MTDNSYQLRFVNHRAQMARRTIESAAQVLRSGDCGGGLKIHSPELRAEAAIAILSIAAEQLTMEHP